MTSKKIEGIGPKIMGLLNDARYIHLRAIA